MRLQWLFGMLVLALLIAPAVSRPESVNAAAPGGQVVSVSPDHGPPGTMFDLVGFGFTPGPVGVYLFQIGPSITTPLGTVPADADGMINGTFNIPPDAVPGPAEVVAVKSGVIPETASAPFLVEESEPIGDDKQPEFCKVTITLKSVKVESTTDPGAAFGLHIDTVPASKGAPGASLDLAVLEGGGDTEVNKVAREYLVPKPAFPTRVVVAAKVDVTSPFTTVRPDVTDSTRILVNCPSSQDLLVKAQFGKKGIAFLGIPFEVTDIITLKYHVEVTEVEAQ